MASKEGGCLPLPFPSPLTGVVAGSQVAACDLGCLLCTADGGCISVPGAELHPEQSEQGLGGRPGVVTSWCSDEQAPPAGE